ncbi:MAG: hypothetical protein H0V26_11400 [Solirubrobacterales bacterium]|nr:hypothetical protein [Solirubrobacterales bacterium]
MLDVAAALELPAPPPDPFEPNDGIEQIEPHGVLPTAKAPLTTPEQRRAVLHARLGVTDDPRDVYRVWVPARHRTIATLRSAQAVDLRLLGTPAPGVGGRRPSRNVLAIANSSRTGTYVYLSVYLPIDAMPQAARYRLGVTTIRQGQGQG